MKMTFSVPSYVMVDANPPNIYLCKGWAIQNCDDRLDFFEPGAWKATFSINFPDKKSLKHFLKTGDLELR